MLTLDRVSWEENAEGQLAAFAEVDGKKQELVWVPQPGSQEVFLDIPPDIFEALYEGTRGPGKTDALLMDYGREVGQGWGSDWRGIIFREEHTQLEDIIGKAKKWFPQLWPASTFNEGKSVWCWPTGERLYFRHVRRLSDYWKYHGHAYPFVGWEELTNWPDDKLYRRMMSICRSTRKGIPRKYRATCNPAGVGHNWVKSRFKLPVLGRKIMGEIITERHTVKVRGVERTEVMKRVAVHGDVRENRILLHAQPTYLAELAESASSEAEREAWLEGSWNIVAGGMFDDLWNDEYHVVPNLPFTHIPKRWRINRSYDHGQSKPFSVGWWAESNGEPMLVDGKLIGQMPGDIIRIGEWYGWNGKENEGLRMLSKDIAAGILQREEDWGILGRVRPGPADAKAFDPNDASRSVAGEFKKAGVLWTEANKGPDSRVQGWQLVRKYLKGAVPDPEGYREMPGIFFCERCDQARRMVPSAVRNEKKLDDVDTESEDHLLDDIRYRVREKVQKAKSRSF